MPWTLPVEVAALWFPAGCAELSFPENPVYSRQEAGHGHGHGVLLVGGALQPLLAGHYSMAWDEY